MVALGIADDEPEILRLFKIMLERSGIAVAYLARDGAEAVALQRKYPADVVLLDYYMPIMDGFRASKAILKEFPDTRVILMTGSDGIQDDVESLGDIPVLKKPFTFRAILDILAGRGHYKDEKE